MISLHRPSVLLNLAARTLVFSYILCRTDSRLSLVRTCARRTYIKPGRTFTFCRAIVFHSSRQIFILSSQARITPHYHNKFNHPYNPAHNQIYCNQYPFFIPLSMCSRFAILRKLPTKYTIPNVIIPNPAIPIT